MATPDQMEESSVEAKSKLEQMDLSTEKAMKIVEWWSEWYMKCGHKRLGRILVNMKKKTE